MIDNDIEKMIVPSAKTIKYTFDEIHDLTKEIRADINSILDTLRLANDTLSVFTSAANLGTGLGAVINPIALSIPITFKAVANIVSNYVTKKTGISFVSWVAFINTSLVQLEEYINQLDNVANVSTKYDQQGLSTKNIDSNQISEDEHLLIDIKSKTVIWNSLMEQTSKLGEVINAILDAQKVVSEDQTGSVETSNDAKKLFTAVTGKVSEVVKSNIKSGQEFLTKWAFSSVYELKDKTKELTNQAKHLSTSISILEDLLDLEIAQIRAYTGKIPSEEVDILGKRVAATVIVPQLKQELLQARKIKSRYEEILEKLEKEQKAKNVSKKIYQELSLEYNNDLNKSVENLVKIEKQVKAWKTLGVSFLDDGETWMRNQLETVKVRELVKEISKDELKQRSKVLDMEIVRFNKAKETILNL